MIRFVYHLKLIPLPRTIYIRLHPYRPNGRNLQTIDPVKNRSLAEEFRSLGVQSNS